ncbi:type III pantothenate kinase [Chloroflexota bacterium]
MLLAVDIGNTRIMLGVYKDDELLATWQVATSVQQTPDEYAVLLLNLLKYQNIDKSKIIDVSMCSVVPPLVPIFEELFQKHFKVSPLVVEAGIKTGIRIRTDNPKEVGADRIVDAVAAYQLYGGPVIVADMGTATTFDTVSREGDYLGGAIAPGMAIAAEALFTRTAKLSKVKLIRPKHVIGTNTVSAMQSGIVFGYVSLVEGMVTRIRKELGEKAKVVGTGGYAQLIANETTAIDIVDQTLTLTGLKMIYQMNKP